MEKPIIVLCGPSGVGKTTIKNHLIDNYDVLFPVCYTTRAPRNDDNGDYAYLSQEEFKDYEEKDLFFMSSGSIDKYGFIRQDYGSPIIITTSYKNTLRLLQRESNVIVIELAYTNIIEEMKNRFESRNNDELLYKKRIRHDIEDHEKYFEEVKKVSSLVIYTDLYSIDEVNNIIEDHLIKLGIISKKSGLLLRKD